MLGLRNREGVKYTAPMQPEGTHVRPLRKHRQTTWVRVCAVYLDRDGCDRLGRYHGRTGVPLFAIEYPDGAYGYFRAKGMARIDLDLRRHFPKAKVEFASVRDLDKSWEGMKR